MKNKLLLILVPVLCLALSGCFGIEEKVLIHKDGSGTFTYTLDFTKMIKEMSELMEGMSKAFKADSTDAGSKKDMHAELYGDISKKMQEDYGFGEKRKDMNAMKGISGFDEFVDTTSGVFRVGWKFDFANVNALNKGLKAMLAPKKDGKKKSQNLPPAEYTFKDGVLTRELEKKAAEELVGTNSKDSEAMLKLMKDFKYQVIVESDKNIKTTLAPGANISKTGKTVTMDYLLLDKSKSKRIVESAMKSEVQVY